MAGNGNTSASRIYNLADILVGDPDAPAPTDLDSDLSADYELVGLISQDDGIGNTFSSDDTDHFAYGSIFIRKTSIKEKRTMTFTALENSDLVWGLANPGSETSEAGGVTSRIRRPRNLALAIRSVVLELDDGEIRSRLYIPRAQIAQTGDQPITDNSIAGYPMTLDVLAANDEDGIFYTIELTDDPDAAPAGS